MMEQARIPITGKVWAIESRHAIVDLGACSEGPRRAETLIALGLPRKRNFTPWINGRLVARVPLADLPFLIASGAPIVEGGTYFQTTHHWIGLRDGEDVAPADCKEFDRSETDRKNAARLRAGSKVFTDWKGWYRGTPAVSKALGGVRRYGIRTPIPLSVVARTHGIGRTVSRFIDRCPTWQRPDAYAACRTVTIEAATRVLHMTKGTIAEDIAMRCIEAAGHGNLETEGIIDQSLVSPLWKADYESMAADSAVQSAFSTLHRWMRTGLYESGDDMMWPMVSTCSAAREAHGYAAMAAAGVRLPEMEMETTMDIFRWKEAVRRHPVYKEAMAQEMLRQVDRLCELTAYPEATMQ